jgi:hypothetical protein
MTAEEFNLCCLHAATSQSSPIALRAFKTLSASCPLVGQESPSEINPEFAGLTEAQQLTVLKLVCATLCTRPLEYKSKLFKTLRNLCKKIRFFEQNGTVTEILLPLLADPESTNAHMTISSKGARPTPSKATQIGSAFSKS